MKPVYSGDWPLPRVIHLPGMRVRVRVVPHDDLVKHGSEYGAFVYHMDDAAQSATIRISDHWPLAMQRYILWHELQHAVVEGLDTMIEAFPDYVQTHAMATLTRLTPAMAQAMIADAPPAEVQAATADADAVPT